MRASKNKLAGVFELSGLPEVKILLLDIESAPNRAYTWGLWDQNIATNQVEETGYVLCWAAQWFTGGKMMFDSVKGDHSRAGRKRMLEGIHALLDEADIVIHYNGQKYDIPTLNKEFIKHGMKPPMPYRQIDLYRVVRNIFRFESNKLSFVSTSLEIGDKVKHAGFTLWVDCMDPARKSYESSWRKMELYNRGDVRLLRKLYLRLRPWIYNHPNLSYGKGLACPKCGSKRRPRNKGTRLLATGTYQRYRCRDCFGTFRTSVRDRKPQPYGIST